MVAFVIDRSGQPANKITMPLAIELSPWIVRLLNNSLLGFLLLASEASSKCLGID